MGINAHRQHSTWQGILVIFPLAMVRSAALSLHELRGCVASCPTFPVSFDSLAQWWGLAGPKKRGWGVVRKWLVDVVDDDWGNPTKATEDFLLIVTRHEGS
jgi:hypothetical protein